MSQCSLIYSYKQEINSPSDLVAIMNTGNQLYSCLSGQAYFMQTELPTMLSVFDSDYQLHYSESYTGTVHQETAIEGYQYCISLQTAFESLISQGYTNFMLTAGCISVAIYEGDVGFKIFDSHARDLYGRVRPQSTCVLLDVLSIERLVKYFQSVHINDIFEVKGVKTDQVQNSIIPNTAFVTKANQSGAVAICYICRSASP